MSEPDDIPEPDRLEGAPHPRLTPALIGQAPAEADFLEAFNSGRLHHAWLITGPKGVGKATLAWRIARFLLATPDTDGDAGLFGAPPPPETLDIAPEHPVSRRLRAMSEPGLFLLRRPWDQKAKRLKQEITVEEARKLKGFFALSSADGGRRVVIVDSADELNSSAANAVLKLLEEPPAKTTLLLVSHQPSRLLPTIRSRCRTLRCGTLAPDLLTQALTQSGIENVDLSGPLAALADGSVGAAFNLVHEEGVAQYGALIALFSTLPRLDRSAAIAMSNKFGGRGNDANFDMTLHLIDLFLARLARCGVVGPPSPEAGPGEAQLLTRLCPNTHAARHWAQLALELGERARHGRAVNLDPAALLLDMVLRINAGAEALSPAQA